ncbi:MAG: hypothetical protein ACOYN0_13565 [Phycisphaerales bacterium]
MRDFLGFVMCGLVAATGASAQEAPRPIDVKAPANPQPPITDAARAAAAKAKATAMIERAAAWMLAGQHESGGFGIYEGAPVFPAVTGLAVMGLMDENRPANSPAMQKAADFVLSKQQADGAIYDRILPSYNTAICVSMLSKYPDPRCRDAMKKGAEYLKGLQYGEGAVERASLGDESPKPVEASHPYYGGIGYGKHGRPDLSNTAFWIEALKDAGVERDDPAFARAVVFLQRVQQLESAGGKPVNDMPYARGSSQGGFIYATSVNKEAVGVGQSFGGEIAESLSGPPGAAAVVRFKAKGADGKPVLLAKEAITKRLKSHIENSQTAAIRAIGDDLQVLMGAGESSGASSCEIRVKCEDPGAVAGALREVFKAEIDADSAVAAEPAIHWRAQSRLRSYGSMSYAGFKSYLYAGLTKDDPRVVAAREWIGANYTVAENPGVGTDGLYYYYVMFAKALHADGRPTVTTPNGPRDWRVDLIDRLAELQNPDGSFRPVDDRWMENDPLLITAYSLTALQAARASLK